MPVLSSPARRSLTRPALRFALCAAGLSLLSAMTPAVAQDVSGFDQLDWTGRPESPVTARKEAGAALVEGKRECARQRDDRATCLKRVQDDYNASLKRLQVASNKR